MVKGRGGGDGEIIALVPVPFRVHPVQGEGHNGQHVGPDGVGGPGGVDFAGGHVLDVILVFYIVIPGCAVPGAAVVDHDVLRHHHPAQDDLSGLIYRLDFILRYFGRIVPVESVGGDHKALLPAVCGVGGAHPYVLDGSHISQDLGPCYADRLKSRGAGKDGVLGVGLLIGIHIQAVLHGRRVQLQCLGLAGAVGGSLLQYVVRDAGVGDADVGSGDRIPVYF